MIGVRLAEEGDKEAWNSFVWNHPLASPYHLFAWRDVVAEAYGHVPYYLIAWQGMDVVGILPILQLRVPLFVNQFVALPFCDIGSILAVDQAVAFSLLEEAVNLARGRGVRSIILRGTLDEDLVSHWKLEREETGKVRMLLELPLSSEALMQQFKSKLRSQIRKAEKNELSFHWGDGDALKAFYGVFCRNMRDLGSPVHGVRFFRKILELYGSAARLGVVSRDGIVVGGAIILSINKRVSIPWASTLRVHNKLAPNMLLYWKILAYATDHGYQIFDFGRSTHGGGTYRFKAQWGAHQEPLDWYSLSLQDGKRPHRRKATANSRELIVKVWQSLPLPFANAIGPVVRKYINL